MCNALLIILIGEMFVRSCMLLFNLAILLISIELNLMYVNFLLFKVVVLTVIKLQFFRIKLTMVLPKNLTPKMLKYKPILLLHKNDFLGCKFS